MEANLKESGGFGLRDQLEELRRQASESVGLPAGLPSALPVKDITLREMVFQFRGLDEKHLGDLGRVIKQGRMFDPLLLIRIGGRAVLIDGHHRHEAYRRAKVVEPVPVEWFAGSIGRAMLEAGGANNKAKLPTTNAERTDFAWRLVRVGEFSKKETAEAACVAIGTVTEMRRVLRGLGEEAENIDEWWKARAKFKGRLGDSPEWDEGRVEALAEDYAERLQKAFGTKLSNNPTVAAMALGKYFGRRMPELLEALGAAPSEPDEDDLDF